MVPACTAAGQLHGQWLLADARCIDSCCSVYACLCSKEVARAQKRFLKQASTEDALLQCFCSPHRHISAKAAGQGVC
jgi:hypothetical protein